MLQSNSICFQTGKKNSPIYTAIRILAFPNLQTSKIWLMSCEGLCGELLPNHLHSPWRIHLLQPLRSESITKLRKDQHKYANCRNSDSEFLYFSAIHSVVIQRKVHIQAEAKNQSLPLYSRNPKILSTVTAPANSTKVL